MPAANQLAKCQNQSARGAMANAGGQAAEAQVARRYTDRGFDLLHNRWRGTAGEIDLIFRNGAEVVFVEVKSSKTHSAAAESLSRRQCLRILQAAEEFLASQPQGSLTPMRIDAAFVNGFGEIDILENALMDL